MVPDDIFDGEHDPACADDDDDVFGGERFEGFPEDLIIGGFLPKEYHGGFYAFAGIAFGAPVFFVVPSLVTNVPFVGAGRAVHPLEMPVEVDGGESFSAGPFEEVVDILGQAGDMGEHVAPAHNFHVSGIGLDTGEFGSAFIVKRVDFGRVLFPCGKVAHLFDGVIFPEAVAGTESGDAAFG